MFSLFHASRLEVIHGTLCMYLLRELASMEPYLTNHSSTALVLLGGVRLLPAASPLCYFLPCGGLGL